jgi:DNA-binding FadR family transcriptional regulator
MVTAHGAASACATHVRFAVSLMPENIPELAPARDPSNAQRSKLAEKIAAQIAQTIIDDGWKVGAPLGNEAALVQRFGASRWAVREALAMIERDGLVELRRGRAGGVFVAAPAATAISTSIRNYLEFARVSVDDIITTRLVLEELALTAAAAKITPDEVQQLRNLVRDVGRSGDPAITDLGFRLLASLLAAAKNPILTVFVEALTQLTIVAGLHSTMSDEAYFDTIRELVRMRCDAVEAVIGYDMDAIYAAVRGHLEVTRKLLEASNVSNPDAPISAHARERAVRLAPALARGKRSERLAQQIQDDIVSSGWPVGQHLGSEPELLARYKVSRSVFRETVRILEQHGVVEMRQGRHSGLKVDSPRPDVVIARARTYFQHANVSRADVRPLQTALERSAAGLVAQRPEAAEIGARLAALAEAPLPIDATAVRQRLRGFYFGLLDACPGVITTLLLRILAELFVLYRLPDQPHRRREFVDTIRTVQLELAHAIQERDAARARRAASRLRAAVLDPMSELTHPAPLVAAQGDEV